MDDNLLKANGSIRHHMENATNDEELTPTLENVIVITWLRLVHPDLPALIKQRSGTELRSQTLASLKPEISQALESLLEEIQSTNESRVLRTAFQQSSSQRNAHPQTPPTTRVPGTRRKICLLCQQTNRSQFYHYLSKCPFLPTPDRQYLTRARQVMSESLNIETASDYIETPPGHIETESIMGGTSHNYRVTPTTRRVCTKRSPHLKVFYHHHALQLTLVTGAEISMIKASVARQIEASIHKTRQTALQADGITPLTVVGEVHFNVDRDHVDLHLDALAVGELDVDILAGTPFMALNDFSVRPSLQQISIQGSYILYYGAEGPDPPQNHVRRTQSHVLRASPSSTVILARRVYRHSVTSPSPP